MPLIVYLDSCDFSDLSEVDARLLEQNRRTLDTIRSAIQGGSAQFVLSSVHLSEAVHATDDPSHKEAAIRRARLMTELCSDNFLRQPQEILATEITKALNGERNAKLSVNELFSGKSEWFGISVPMDFSQKHRNSMAHLQEINAHLPRTERRKLKSEWSLSKASGREKWRSLASGSSVPMSHEFPFSLFSSEFVIEWIIGNISDDVFSNRMYEILNNPLGLVQNVLDLTENRHNIYALLRSEGQRMQARMDEVLQSAIDRIGPFVNSNLNFDFSTNFRENIPLDQMRRTIVSLYGKLELDDYSDEQIARIIAACPAASTFLNMYIAYYSSRFESTLQRMRNGSTTPRSRGASDFGDMMHAVYAPYCDLFRCDAFFSSLLRQDPAIRSRVIERSGLNMLSRMALT